MLVSTYLARTFPDNLLASVSGNHHLLGSDSSARPILAKVRGVAHQSSDIGDISAETAICAFTDDTYRHIPYKYIVKRFRFKWKTLEYLIPL